jgi:hypothetical protein
VNIGVAYWIEGQESIHSITEWPGVSPHATRNQPVEAPTKIAYNPNDKSMPLWGYLVSNRRSPAAVQEYFKFYLDDYPLDETYIDHLSRKPTITMTELLIRDFLTEFLRHSKEIVEAALKHSPPRAVEYEYHFSVPTTWSKEPVEIFAEIITKAMRGLCQSEAINICLTDAEAAANYTAVEYQERLQVSCLEIDIISF